MMEEPHTENRYPESEKNSTFFVLMFVGGFFGAFTFSVRGGVFCNAQTANFVLSALALGNGNWHEFFYYFIPMTAYFMGAFLSESMLDANVKLYLHIRWETLFLLLEMAAVVFLGLLPESAPYRISQVTVNLFASMQYNTFRQAERIPMATTFCTNHLRQVGIAASQALRHRDKNALRRMFTHCRMLLAFVLGGTTAAILCRHLLGKAILFTLIPLAYLFIDFLHEDINSGRSRLA